MGRGAEALDNSINELEGRKISELRSDKEMGQEHSKNVTNLEAAQIRKGVLDRMSKDDKGVISDKEKKGWEDKMDQANLDISRMQSIKGDFEEEWRQSLEMRKQFDTQVHGADEKGMLRRGEHETLDQTFLKSDLKEKERALKDLEKELHQRRKELDKFMKLEKDVRDKRHESLKRAEDWDAKLEVLESAEKENQLYQSYRALFKQHAKKLAKKTVGEYLEWFLTLSEGEQQGALRKAEREDIQPRAELFDIHSKLPKKYQESSFKEWGKNERERYLSGVEQRIEREHRGVMRKEARAVFSEKEFKFCEQSFAQISEPDLGKRLQLKAEFLDALPGHIKIAKKQWDQFERFDPAIQDMLNDEFKEGNFDERKDILTKTGPKLMDRYTKLLNRLNNKVDPHVSEASQSEFEKAKTIEAKTLAVETAEKFQKSKDRYKKEWDKAKKKGAFRSEWDTYENWYQEKVGNLKEAEKTERQLHGMIEDRMDVVNGIKKLPPHLRERANPDQSFSKREKELHKLQEIAKYYETVIPFMLKNAEKAEKEDDFDKALDFYLQALKLDPDSKDLRTLVAGLRQRGATHSLAGSSKEDDAQTEEVLKTVDSMHEITKEQEELAREQLLLNLAKKHKERVGASGSTTKVRAQSSVKQLEKDDRETAEALLGEHGDTHTVDEEGTVRKKMKVKTSGSQERETEEQIQRFFSERQHKGDITQKGMAEVAFVNKSGQEMEIDTAQKDITARTAQLAKARQKNFIGQLEGGKTTFTEKQLDAIRTAYEKAHSDDELVEAGIEKLKSV